MGKGGGAERKRDTFALKPTEAGNVILSAVQRLYAEEKLVDVKISGKDCSSFNCHKLVLASFSAYFECLLSVTEGSALLNLDHVVVEHSKHLRSIINFMYGYNIQVYRKDGGALLEAAKLFQVTALVKTLEAQISKPGEDSDLFVLKPTGINFLLLVNFQRFRREKKFVDARIGLSDSPSQSYSAHKLVLASFSTYFESLLQGTETSAILGLESVDPLYIQQLPIILNYMYGEPVKLVEKQMVVLLDAARVFGIHSLEEGELVRLYHRAQKQSQQRLLDQTRKRRKTDSEDPPDFDGNQQEAIRRAWNARKQNPVITPGVSLAPIQVSQRPSPKELLSTGGVKSGMSSPDYTAFAETVEGGPTRPEVEQSSDICQPSSEGNALHMVRGDQCLETASTSYYDYYPEVPLAEGEITIDPTCFDGSYMCSDCGSLFNDSVGLNSHISSAHDKSDADGPSQDSGDFSEEELSIDDSHDSMNLAQTQDSVTQMQSNTASSAPRQLKPKPSCPACRAVFTSLKNFKQHFAEEHDGLVDICSICYTVVKTRKDLIRHLETSHQFKALHCRVEGCSKVFQSRMGLASHLETHKDGTSLFNCSDCDYVGKNKANLKIHIKKTHSKNSSGSRGKNNFQCSDCPQSFTFKSFLTRHFNKVHLKLRPYRCPHCDHASSEKNALQIHIRCAHTGEKPFHCESCIEQFSTPSHLSRHKRVHHNGIKNNVCKICQKEFVESRDLKVHINRDHMEERPYSCPDCTAGFFRKDHVLVHRRRVHGFKS